MKRPVMLQRIGAAMSVTGLALGLAVMSPPKPAAASIFGLGQLAQQIGQIQQLLNSPYGNLSLGNGGLGSIFQQQYPGAQMPGNPNQMVQQLIRNKLGSALGSMKGGQSEIQSSIFGDGQSVMLDGQATAAAVAGTASGYFGIPNPVPIMYVDEQTNLAHYQTDLYHQAEESSELQAINEYNASEAQIQALGYAQGMYESNDLAAFDSAQAQTTGGGV